LKNQLFGGSPDQRFATEHGFHKLASAIRQAIAQGELAPGDKLPSQREIQARFGVSKVTVLEALRLLEAEGLVEVRLGRNGGAVILDASWHSLSRAVALLLEMDRVDLEEMRVLRAAIEVQTARLAAVHAAPEHLLQLERQLEALERHAAQPDTSTKGLSESDRAEASDEWDEWYEAADLEFHAAIAAVSGNRLLKALMDVLYQHTFEREVPVDRATQRHLNQSLRRVLEAIRGRSPSAAARAMSTHITQSFRIMQLADRQWKTRRLGDRQATDYRGEVATPTASATEGAPGRRTLRG
jgi:GntR family transcriptional regulator, transcriptional repressor for pyruvate dehydrogenase complex